MQVTETSAEGLLREYRIIVPAGDIESRIQARLTDLSGRIRLPGFRPGKVPMKILRQRYGKSIMGEVLEGAVDESSRETMTERGIRPALQPKIEITRFDDGTDLEYTLAVELLPEIEPYDFAALELTRLFAEVTDDTVRKGLEKLAASRKTFTKPTRARAAKMGDQVLIDFAGSIDGEALVEMQGEEFELELGSGQMIPGFEEQIAGHKEGAFAIEVIFPADYPDDKLAGRPAAFDITLKEVREPVALEVAEELAKEVGFDDLESLKGAVRRQTESEFAGASRARLKRQLLDKLADAYSFELPAGMVDAEFDAIWKQVEEARQHAHDHDHDHVHDHDDPDAGKSDDELKEEYRGIAERRVRLGLVLSDVGRQNNLQVSKDELNRAMLAEARRYRGQEQQVLEFFQKNPQAVEGLRAPILEDKVVDYILEIAKVEEQVVTPEELLRDPDDDATDQTAGGDGKAAKKKTAKASPSKAKTKTAAKDKPAGDE